MMKDLVKLMLLFVCLVLISQTWVVVSAGEIEREEERDREEEDTAKEERDRERVAEDEDKLARDKERLDRDRSRSDGGRHNKKSCFKTDEFRKRFIPSEETIENKKAEIDKFCRDSDERDNCIKDALVRDLTPNHVKEQINIYLHDQSLKPTFHNLVDKCFLDKRRFYPCLFRGFEEHCPELQDMITDSLRHRPYFYSTFE